MPIDLQASNDKTPGDAAVIRRMRFVVPATLDEVRAVAQALRAFMADFLPEECCDAIELGVVEALTNVVVHGYAARERESMELLFEQSLSSAVVRVTDSGTPIPDEALKGRKGQVFEFDPTDVENLPVGGMGLSLINELFDVVLYETTDGVNRLLMTKRFGTYGDDGDARVTGRNAGTGA